MPIVKVEGLPGTPLGALGSHRKDLIARSRTAYRPTAPVAQGSPHASDPAAVQETIDELTAALAAETRATTEFCDRVSHDLAAPLRTITAFGGLLTRESNEALSDDARRYVALMVAGASEIGDLVHGLTALSQAAAHRLGAVECTPADVASDALAGISAAGVAGADAVQVSEMPSCLADPALLRTVYERLLENALKFTGGEPEPRIEVGADTALGKTIYFVRDNGIGFEQRHAETIFEPFERLQPPEEYPGAGVGLAIVELIMERQGGRAWAEGVPGQGATFFFALRDEAEMGS